MALKCGVAILLALTSIGAVSASSAVHEGHRPVHVTRLHRYDHAGPESFIQAEAAWSKNPMENFKEFMDALANNPMDIGKTVGQDPATSLMQITEIAHKMGVDEKMMMQGLQQWNGNMQKMQEMQKAFEPVAKQAAENFQAGMEQLGSGLGLQVMEKVQQLPFFPGDPFGLKKKSKFGVLSQAQLNTLKAHRENHFAHGGADEAEFTIGGGKGGETGTEAGSEAADEMGTDVMKAMAQHRVVHNYRQPDYHVTGLSNLYNSQYVGPLGVGTTKSPQNCVLPGGKDIMFISGLDSKATAEEKEQCHLTEQEQVWVVFDSGSTNVWLSTDMCTTSPCTNPGRHRFNHLKSATFTEPAVPIQLDITFGTGELKGPQGIDDLHVGPFTVRQQTFGMIEKEIGGVFTEVPFEGILGLAFPAMSANGVKPFFDNVIEQKVMKRNEFAFYFNSDDKAGNGIFWGGVDPAFYEGEIRMFPVTQPYYWAVDLHKFMIGDTEIEIIPEAARMRMLDSPLNPFSGAVKQAVSAFKEIKGSTPKLIVDSGTTYFTAESGVYNRVMKHLPSAKCSEISDKTHPPLKYLLKDAEGNMQEYVIPAEEYMVSDERGDTCEPAFMKIDIPKKYGPGMILGEVFMRNYFTVFDRADGQVGNARIGFARARKGTETDTRLKSLTSHQGTFKQTHGEKSSMLQGVSHETTKFHQKPNLLAGSSELQTGEKKHFRVNPFLKKK